MDILVKIYEECQHAFNPLFRKNIKLSKKVKSLLFLVIVLFILAPVGINFLAMVELNYYTNMIHSASQIDSVGMMIDLKPSYDNVINKIAATNLPINSAKNIVVSFITGFFSNSTNINAIHLSNIITYIGFSFKIEIFMPIFMWNFIPLFLFSVLISVSIDSGKMNKILSCLLYTIALSIASILYSGAVAYVISRLSFIVIESITLTKILTVLVSFLFFIFWVYKVYKTSNKKS